MVETATVWLVAPPPVKVSVVVSDVYPLAQAADAHAALEAGHVQGKIVLDVA